VFQRLGCFRQAADAGYELTRDGLDDGGSRRGVTYGFDDTESHAAAKPQDIFGIGLTSKS
jgi:hypothetical protein